MESKGRVLGAVRTLSEAVSAQVKTEEARVLVLKVVSGKLESFNLHQLEQALCYFTNHNSEYTNVTEDEFHVLAEETLNNSIRSILVYDDFSGYFGDAEVYSLSMAFQYNLSVEALTLSGINISDESICALCEALVRSRVNYIDLSNTPLEDEAGRSIAALAHVNPYLRTVIVDDTLIADDVLDEIDVACQFNHSNWEGNDSRMDEALLRSSDLIRLKHRLQHIIRAQHKKVHFCVAHLFGCCPNGDLCLYSHSLGTSELGELDTSLSAKISELFASGGNWEERLPPRPSDGASWRNPEDAVKRRPRLNKTPQERQKAKEEEDKKTAAAAAVMDQARSHWAPLLNGLVGMCCGMLVVGVISAVARRIARSKGAT
ncbi:hypothetical protein ABB37_09837 [Leptomonas pyrrhocoris]|uniref:C3H1-type domain-containing protein n=1 Tax=Leptomonas pyrrhocoris TaxID=157538 RepID=A0A0M9FQ05_LEPPY|nr:hypothetical protein ABB37_09837 [Leptomonas pyrrhocoris]XP_015651966.1 hypothetical protein ABB37_09837 [Leptomonas pyrrhocoris]KPA73526.1 hypothetical protein ABB37_09837 [Leptomonas pyrrhocoris]KPA73527.1 hypothetical protein ABB37_09837 [Leptomonas pyrrhocoris]|eukprot:XP_015651965.1 hypothetical protein ABB37_09837 [Leptomonas pyrrhocoris]